MSEIVIVTLCRLACARCGEIELHFTVYGVGLGVIYTVVILAVGPLRYAESYFPPVLFGSDAPAYKEAPYAVIAFIVVVIVYRPLIVCTVFVIESHGNAVSAYACGRHSGRMFARIICKSKIYGAAVGTRAARLAYLHETLIIQSACFETTVKHFGIGRPRQGNCLLFNFKAVNYNKVFRQIRAIAVVIGGGDGYARIVYARIRRRAEFVPERYEAIFVGEIFNRYAVLLFALRYGEVPVICKLCHGGRAVAHKIGVAVYPRIALVADIRPRKLCIPYKLRLLHMEICGCACKAVVIIKLVAGERCGETVIRAAVYVCKHSDVGERRVKRNFNIAVMRSDIICGDAAALVGARVGEIVVTPYDRNFGRGDGHFKRTVIRRVIIGRYFVIYGVGDNRIAFAAQNIAEHKAFVIPFARFAAVGQAVSPCCVCSVNR